MKQTLITLIYFLTGLSSILLLNQSSFLPGFISKALIIPILIILFAVNLNPFSERLHKYMFAALLFAWAGDVVLELVKYNETFFTAGLCCFLIAHIMYSIIFFTTPGKNSIFSNRAYLIIPVIVYGIALVTYLYSDLNAMKIPVIIYAVAILIMLTGAINRRDKVNRLSFYMVLGGAILFLISDSLIAVNKFSFQFKSSGIVIMATYISAQYLIVQGYIYQLVRPDGSD